MRYLDTGSRDPEQSLAAWLNRVLSEPVAEFRLQSGFFSAKGLGLLIPTLEAAAKANSHTHILLGSNDGVTLRDDVEIIARAMGLPRTNGWLGIVSFAGAYFHAKAFHILRLDGSQAAVVGSGNLTPSGLALHVEAAISLDTRDGDPPQELNRIAASIDAWFKEKRNGLTIVEKSENLEKLVADGVLSVAPPPKPAGTATTGEPAQRRKPGLKPLFALPAVKSVDGMDVDEGDVDQTAAKPRPAPAGSPALSSAAEVLLMRVRPRRNGKQLQISMRVHKAPFMKGAKKVVSIGGAHREIGYNKARGVRNTARFEAPEMMGMKNPVARFQWVRPGRSEKVLQYEIFDADRNAEGARIFRKLKEGIGNPPVTNLDNLSKKETVLSTSARATAQWYRLGSA